MIKSTFSRICRPWRDIAIKNPLLWTDIDFSGCRRIIPMETVRAYVRRSQGKMTHFALGRSSNSQQAILCYVADRCKGLQALRLGSSLIGASLLKVAPGMPNLRSLVLSSECEISCDTAIEVLLQCSQLERAEFPKTVGGISMITSEANRFPSLRHLIMDQDRQNRSWSSQIPQFLSTIPNIRSLRLRRWTIDQSSSGFSELEYLDQLDLGGCYISHVPLLPASLRGFSMARAYSLATLHMPRQDLPNLTHLSFCHYTDRGWLTLEPWLYANKGNLLELDLGGISIGKPRLLSLLGGGYFVKIEVLYLAGCDFDDTLVDALSQYASSLRHLDLSRTSVTGVGVKGLVTRLGSTLQFLNLDSCHSTSIDAVQWARSTGLQVQYSFPENSGKGKKVRST